jgi:Domain of unknown function (DUF4136)
MRNSLCFGLAFSLVLFFAVKPSDAQNITSDWAKGYNFGELKHFAWKQNHLITVRRPEDNKLLDEKIVRAVTQELASKGIVEDSTHPDFYLFYHAGPGDEGLQTGAAAPAGLESIPPPGSSSPGLVAGPNIGFAPNVWYSVQGKFVFYALDSKSNIVIWQGTATKRWHDPQKARKNEDKEIKTIVSKSFKDFPPRTKK